MYWYRLLFLYTLRSPSQGALRSELSIPQIYQVFTCRTTLKMEKHVLYDPIAQNDVSESPFNEPEDRTFGDEHTSRKSPSSYAKLGAAIVIFIILYTVATVNLTMRVAHRDQRVGRRFLDTPVSTKIHRIRR